MDCLWNGSCVCIYIQYVDKTNSLDAEKNIKYIPDWCWVFKPDYQIFV